MTAVSAPVRYHGWMAPDGTCMAIPVKDGPRCTARAEYEAVVRFPGGREVTEVLWCRDHAAAVRAEHPEQVAEIRTWPRR